MPSSCSLLTIHHLSYGYITNNIGDLSPSSVFLLPFLLTGTTTGMLLHHLHMDGKTTESQNMFSKAVQALNKNTLDQLPKLLRVNKFPHAEKRKIMWYLPVYGEEAFGDRKDISEKDISEMPLCLRPRWRRYRKKFLELQDEEKNHEAAIARVRISLFNRFIRSVSW